ncbi:hypothetical protein ACFVIM_26085 [Streptomyces sp. NPDC057638]|uniref:hypothetical protein n=1 Tax=Streptomyces sp. NPDC057638 TaxID=3346190 RepID=UPI0036C47894
MSGTAYDPPRALPINTDAKSASEDVEPLVSSTQRPPSRDTKPGTVKQSSNRERGQGDSGREPSLTPSPDQGTPARDPASDKPSGGAKPDHSEGDGAVQSHTVDGGRVVLSLGEKSAQLVNATPNPGWEMKVWTEPFWLRVTFTKDGREVSVFCTWNGGEPRVEFDDRTK